MIKHCAHIVIAMLSCLLAVAPRLASAQTDLQRAQNLATCLTGRYPLLCKREWLTAEEARKADSAERRENLRVCLTGKYPTEVPLEHAKLRFEPARA